MVKCPSCGADNPPNENTCSFCGSHLPLPAGPDSAPDFARVRASSAYSQRNAPQRLAQLPKVGSLQKVFFFGFFGIFITTSLVIFFMALGMAGAFGAADFGPGGGFGGALALIPLLIAVVPLGFVVLGVVLAVTVARKMKRMEHDPVRAFPAVVVDKRTQTSGGRGDRAVRTVYYVTCENEEGRRDEYQVWDGRLYGRMSSGDAGVMFTRAGYAVDFDRVQ